MKTLHRAEQITPTQRMLNMWAIVLIMWAFYRAHFKTELPMWVDEFVAKPLIFITPLWYYIQKYEHHHNVLTALSFKLKGLKWDIVIGLLVGAIFFIGGASANYMKYQTIFPKNPIYLGHYNMFLLIAVAIASAITEEILMRGFVLKRLYEESKQIFRSAFFVSFLFFFLHIPILFTSKDITGYTILQVMATDLALSLCVSLLYLQRRNIALPIIIHVLYNLSLYLFL
jgi:membrane protease YdiL (CAAX protease family)